MAEHDPETVRVGLESIARIRAQLASQSAKQHQIEERPRHQYAVQHAAPASQVEPSVDQMRVDMALASEREQLLATIRQRDARIAQLEVTLAAVVRAAAGGIDSTSTREETEPQKY